MEILLAIGDLTAKGWDKVFMLPSRKGWQIVAIIVVFLFLRALTGLLIEVRWLEEAGLGFRIVIFGIKVVVIVGLAFGSEVFRFLAVIGLVLASVNFLNILIDPDVLGLKPDDPNLRNIKIYATVVVATNLVLIPILAFARPVRSYFSKLPAHHYRPR